MWMEIEHGNVVDLDVNIDVDGNGGGGGDVRCDMKIDVDVRCGYKMWLEI